MIKTIKELKKEGWQQISADIWLYKHAENHYIFYNTKTYTLGEHVWSKSFEKNLTNYIRNCVGINMTKSKFFKTYGEEEGKMMIIINIAKLYTKNPLVFYSTKNGKKVYERQMIVTDPNYRIGMKVIAYIHNEEIIGKHFDNVVYK